MALKLIPQTTGHELNLTLKHEDGILEGIVIYKVTFPPIPMVEDEPDHYQREWLFLRQQDAHDIAATEYADERIIGAVTTHTVFTGEVTNG
jgi:hypothetical protein